MWYHDFPFEKGKQILILRHGERPSSPQGSFGHEISLTPQGKIDSERAGEKLQRIRWGEIHSSPILRCQETAHSFLKGTKQNTSIHLSSYLGDPGVFVAEPEVAGPHFLNKTNDQMIYALHSGEQIPGVRSIKEGCLLFIEYLKTIELFPCIMFSHDIIIALLKSYFFNTSPQLPSFLDGFCISKENL